MEKFCTQNSIASQTVKSQVKMKTFSDMQVSKSLPPLHPYWGSALRKFYSKMRMRTRKEEETESRKQWTSPRMCHSSVTLIQQDVSRWSDSSPAHPFQMRMHSRRALWEEYAFYAMDGIIDKLACLRIWRTYILQSTKKKTKQTCHEIHVQLWNNNKKKYSWMEWKKSLDFTLAVGTFPFKWHRHVIDVYRRKWPSFYLVLSKQYLHSQNNLDAIYQYTVFWSAHRQNMKGLNFLFRNEAENNSDKLRKNSRKRLRITCEKRAGRKIQSAD